MSIETMNAYWADMQDSAAQTLATDPGALESMRRLAEQSGVEQEFTADVVHLLHEYHNHGHHIPDMTSKRN